MKTVLVTAVGSFAGGVVLENLKKDGCRTVACDMHPKAWVANASRADAFYRSPPAADAEAYLRFLRTVCVREQVDFLVPLTDPEIDVLNRNRAWFAERRVCLCIPGEEAVDRCRSKYRAMQLVPETGAVRPIPTKWFLECHAASLRFPVVCKPVDGRSSRGMRIVRSEREWQIAAETVGRERYVVQPYIDGVNVTADVIRQAEGKRTVVLLRQEWLRTANGAGLSVQIFADAALQSACTVLADALGVTGCVNFEFIRHVDGGYYFLECNPRFSGGVEFSCMAGYDCVRNHLRCFAGQEIDTAPPFRPMRMARRYEACITETGESE